MNPASPEPTNTQQHPGTRSLDPHNSTFPISELPSELLSIVLRYSLPEFDAMESTWGYDDCRPDMTRLFSLRRVSTLWRDLIDSTPSLWMLISSTWSPEAIKMVLCRSGTCPLVIHLLSPGLPDGLDEDKVEFGREFLRLVNPHRSRWAVAIIQSPLELASEFFDTPLPRLDTLALTLTTEAPEESVIPVTPIIADILGNLEHVKFNCVPFQWNQVLGRFKGLKTLSLSLLRGHGITAEQITNAISMNSTLEKIVLCAVEAEAPPMPVDWAFSNPARTTLPGLRVFKAEGSLYLLDTILRNIHIVHELDELMISAASSSSPRNDMYFWMKTVSPLFPTLRRMHKTKDGSSITLKDGERCVWTTNRGDGTGFRLSIDGLDHDTVLEWIASVVEAWKDAEEDLPGFRFLTSSAFIEDSLTLSALQTVPRVTSIDVSVGLLGFHPWRFLGVLGYRACDPPTGPPPFPFLQHLRLRTMWLDLDKWIEVVKRRYTTHQPEGWQPRSALQLDFTTDTPIWFDYVQRPRAIILLKDIMELCALDGVASVRLGCSKEQPGMLAVVLNEEEGRLVWG